MSSQNSNIYLENITIQNSNFINKKSVFLFSNNHSEIVVSVTDLNFIGNYIEYSNIFDFKGQHQKITFDSLNFLMNYGTEYAIYFYFLEIQYFSISFQNYFMFSFNFNGNYYF